MLHLLRRAYLESTGLELLDVAFEHDVAQAIVVFQSAFNNCITATARRCGVGGRDSQIM